MKIDENLKNTPRFVLLEGRQPIRPNVLNMRSGQACSAIYGFSDRKIVDQFLQNCSQKCSPQPLVKGHLQRISEKPGGELKIVLLDALSPNEATLIAATIDDVLHAHSTQCTRVSVTWKLEFNRLKRRYRILEHGELMTGEV